MDSIVGIFRAGEEAPMRDTDELVASTRPWVTTVMRERADDSSVAPSEILASCERTVMRSCCISDRTSVYMP